MRLIYFAFLTFTFIISSCFFTTLYAQNISQLESQLQQASEIEKANIQLQLGHLHLNRDPERSISLANKVLKFGVTTNNYELQANARLILAHASFKKKEYEKAYINTEKADNYLNPLYSSASFNQLRKEKYKFQFLTKHYCLFY